MNKLTRQIRNKGYTLQEFCESIGFSLRWYRAHEHNDSRQNKMIVAHINELETK